MLLTKHRRIRARRGAALALSTLGVAGASSYAPAADVSWVTPGGGAFGTGGNWATSTPPGPDDRAVFNLLGFENYSVSFDADVTNQNLLIAHNWVTLDLGGNTYRLNGTDASTGRAELVGTPNEPGFITLQNGTLDARSAHVGVGTGANQRGIARVHQGATLAVSHQLRVGTGEVEIEHGGRLDVGRGHASPVVWAIEVGSGTGAAATVRVVGPESRINNHASMVVGFNALGYLGIEDGAQVNDYSPWVGYALGTTGVTAGSVLITGPGSAWTSAASRGVGGRGALGDVEVRNGGLMRTLGAGNTGDLVDGRVLVSGAGSRYVLDTGIAIGHQQPASVRIEGGGELTSGIVNLGWYDGSAGELTVTGPGSRVAVGSFVSVGSTPQVGQSGAGTLLVADGARYDNAGSLAVYNTGTVRFDGGSFAAGALEVRGGRVLLRDGADKVLRTRAVTTPDGGSIDLTDNFMTVDYTGPSPIASVRDQIATAHAGGAWTGPGIGTTWGTPDEFALGFAERAALGAIPAIFGDADADTILIRLTRYGDADLDGAVTLQDFNRLAINFGATDGAVWSEGDFNYDGVINLSDFNRLAINFGQSAAGPDVTPQDWANLAAVIPEPGGIGLLFAGGSLLVRRRR